MLFKLSVKNLRKSLKDYSIYFFTLFLGVCVFYMFNAIEDQTAMMELSQVTSHMISIMNIGLSVMSVFVSVILGFLIVYASRFLIRKRTAEFGIYLTLGMRKSAIAQMLVIETFLIGSVSLVAGLAAGIVLSQFMSLLVAGMFEADMERFVFVLSAEAVWKTILYYLVIYVVVIVANTVSVVRSRLIDLLLANRKKEEVHLKHPLLCMAVFAVGAALLGIAYYNVTANQTSLETESDVLLMLVFGIAGTFLVFWSVSGFVLGVARRIKGVYFRGTHSFILNETGNRIQSFVMAGSIICLLLFVTICALSGAFALKSYKSDLLKKRVPVSVSMSRDSEDGKSVSDALRDRGFDMNVFAQTTEIRTWNCETVRTIDIFETAGEELIAQSPVWKDYLEGELKIVLQSDYNEAAKRYGFAPVELEEDEYLAFCEQPKSAFGMLLDRMDDRTDITVGSRTLRLKSAEIREGFLMMSDEPSYEEMVIVPDDVPMEALRASRDYLIADYDPAYETKAFYEYMDDGGFDAQVNPEGIYVPGGILVSTRSAITDGSVGTSGIAVFVALYLGIVFMICSAALLALKSMSDAMDSRGKYEVLRRLGAEEKEISRALMAQMGIFFGFPLLLAAVHSIFGIQVVNEMLSIYKTDAILPALVTAAGMIVVVYGGYFAASYHACRRAIAGK